MNLEITVYDDHDQVLKTCNANTVDLRFGQVAALMELLEIESVNDSVELMRTVNKAWKELTKILTKIFPEMEEDDWSNVKISELLPVVVMILKSSFAEMMKIPKSKNG